MEASVHGTGPHDNQPVASIGPRPEEARIALVMVHGRNASAESILELAEPLDQPDCCYLAPAAAGNTWYPYSFMADIPRNEPGITSGIGVIDRLVHSLESRGLPRSKIFLLGFSQGACLASTYAVRHAGRFGGIFVLSGGLIGPAGTRWEYPGSFEGTPVFLGCSDVDGHIPKERVEESAAVFRKMGADVTMKLYPGMGHTVSIDELKIVRGIIERP